MERQAGTHAETARAPTADNATRFVIVSTTPVIIHRLVGVTHIRECFRAFPMASVCCERFLSRTTSTVANTADEYRAHRRNRESSFFVHLDRHIFSASPKCLGGALTWSSGACTA